MLNYYGNINEDLLNQIRDGSLPGMTFEGVVSKAKNLKKPGLSQMFKIKNVVWCQALRNLCKDDDELFEVPK